MNRRLATALEELEHADEFQHRVVNDDLDVAVKEFIDKIRLSVSSTRNLTTDN